MVARCFRYALLALALIPAAGARAASIWTPAATGTTATITAIAAPKAGEVVFVTANGEIHRLVGSSFVSSTVTPANPLGFTDVAMSADGTKGVAVGAAGAIYHSSDSGATWTPPLSAVSEPSGACPSPTAATPLGDNLSSVKFADATTVWVTGENNDVLRSTDAGAHFSERNKSVGSCKANPGGTGQAFTDSFWIDANHGSFLSNFFGEFFTTTDGLATPITQKGSGVNGFTYRDQMAVDTGDPNHVWAIAGGPGGSYFQVTTDGGTTWNTPHYDDNQVGLRDIAAVGQTVVAVGDGGDIYTSPDGSNFFRQIAAPPNATTNWRAVAVLNGTTAFVGGAGGVLLVSTQANAVPDTTAPTGTIAGPKSLAPAQFGTYSVSAVDNPGGSGIDPASYVWSTAGLPSQSGSPTAKFAFSDAGSHLITVAFKDLAGNPGSASITVNVATPPVGTSGGVSTSSGGTTIVVYKIVTVTGRKGRYIPVKISTKHPRRFVISLVSRKKGHKTLAKLSVTLRKGKRTVHLGLPRSVKSGSYQLVVQVFTTGKHGHRTGKTVKQVFVLR
jgi:photosystem II stability/assembly factor-like uncharacterized protein